MMHLANPLDPPLWTNSSTGQLMDPGEIGNALEACRQYLALMTGRMIGNDLRVKSAASDIVQETIMEAYRDFGQFHGRTSDDLRAWLYRILRHNLSNLAERYRGTNKRQLAKEVSLDQDMTAGNAAGDLPARTPSPSDHAINLEQAQILSSALKRLSEHHRQVLQWRHREYLSFEEIGRHLGKSAEAARKDWARAVDRLRWEVELGAGFGSQAETAG